ncbi:hypothetical protein SAMN04487967_0832 [Natronorubrum sediminis]|uniref:Halobacterial output domain-containing protein n=1 Tax=Natronorubrum sediminis TaxID=640943 RepID=A0A1H6FQS3_9EURY|nr:HalOD1 output domain-containing protein [Natronorubrum sediminis]SEH12488.1 hypothetical protein SAMN04487967_0832 [Natronorubrum sediminis]
MSKTTRDRLTQVNEQTGRPVYYDDSRGTYHVWCQTSDYEPVSTALVLAVSSILGVETEDLESLSRRVDPDALNGLVSHWDEIDPRTSSGSVGFRYASCRITVYADGEIVIDPDHHLRERRSASSIG